MLQPPGYTTTTPIKREFIRTSGELFLRKGNPITSSISCSGMQKASSVTRLKSDSTTDALLSKTQVGTAQTAAFLSF